MDDAQELFLEFWSGFVEFADGLHETVFGNDIWPQLAPYMTMESLMSSIWFPASVVSICMAMLYKNQREMAAVVFLVTCALYIFYYLVPSMTDDLNGVLYFGIATVVVAAVAIYFLFIRAD